MLKKSLAIILGVLLIDQIVKIYIKTNFYYGESIDLFGLEWMKIQFVENEGMAFGWKIPFFSPEVAKIILTSFRIVAVSLIGYYLYDLIRKEKPRGIIISLSLIFAGAVGNILDSIFYGVFFSSSVDDSYTVAEMFPDAGGYGQHLPLSGWLQGNVVDMLFYAAEYPAWIPWAEAGDKIFPPVFNVADSAITIGVILIVIFQRKYIKEELLSKKNENEEATTIDVDSKNQVESSSAE